MYGNEETLPGLVPEPDFGTAPADITYVSPVDPGVQAPGQNYGTAPTPETETEGSSGVVSIFGDVVDKKNNQPPSLLKGLLWVGAGIMAYQMFS